ncbi:MAG: hypothetical protein Q7T03_01010 [Deltaproteobacteria bacterium]|nr:hypothetical protein [Deltaproteobacteria bacterium]
MRFALEEGNWCLVKTSWGVEQLSSTDACQALARNLVPELGGSGNVQATWGNCLAEPNPISSHPQYLPNGLQQLRASFYEGSEIIDDFFGTNEQEIRGVFGACKFNFLPNAKLFSNILNGTEASSDEQKEWEKMLYLQIFFIHQMVDYFRCGPPIDGFELVQDMDDDHLKTYRAVETATGRSLAVYFESWDCDPMPEKMRINYQEGDLERESFVSVDSPAVNFPVVRDFERVFEPKPECQPPPGVPNT